MIVAIGVFFHSLLKLTLLFRGFIDSPTNNQFTMPKSFYRLCLVVGICAVLSKANAQDRRPQTAPGASGTGGTPTPNAGAAARVAPKPYKEVVTDKAKTSKGLFTVHRLEDKFYFEVPDSLIGREFIAVTRVSKTPASNTPVIGLPIYGGEEANTQVLRWEKGPDNKLFLRVSLYVNVSPDSTKPISLAVKNSNVDPIGAAFDIKAFRKDTSTVIDVTDFFKGDNQVVSLPPQTKQRYRLTAIQADRSYIQTIKSFPINTEIRSVKTFAVTPPAATAFGAATPGPSTVNLPAGNEAGVITMEMNTSLLLLPKVPMRRRFTDDRVGYFSNGYTVYKEDSHKSQSESFITRWRLEPKNAADAERQKKGELIEPQKPIVFYVDPAAPEKWKKYLKQGVDDWQKAFEQAGWKNAIRGEMLTEKDSTISLEDARYSAIRYFASNIENAYGPHVSDPRSGEILESHIGWYHNVMSLLTKWFFIQTAAANPQARKPKFDDELMGQLIRFVSSHEVGHTLGLPHNFGSSHSSPIAKLRDKNWILQHGHTPSIMDYARFNYVAQPEDGVTDFFPRIGEYDRWSIEWGYKPIYEAATSEDEKKTLNKWILTHVNDPVYFYGRQGQAYDPRSQSEDIGDNAMQASELGIKNLQRIVPNLSAWLKEEAEDYDKLNDMYREVSGQFSRYLGHVTKYVGGIYETPKSFDQDGAVFETTPKALQKEAVSFLQKQLFETPKWLLDEQVLSKLRPDAGVETIRLVQDQILNTLLSNERLGRIIESSTRSATAYNMDEYLTDLRTGIWSELKAKKPIDQYRRNLQKVFVEKMASLLNPPNTPTATTGGGGFQGQNTGPSADLKKSDILSLVRAHSQQLRDEIKASLPLTTDKMSKYHLQDCVVRLERALDPK